MKKYKHLEEYSVMEINGILEKLRGQYDMVQLVDVEECRVLEVRGDGHIHYGRECYRIWDRDFRCEDCSGYRACMTHQCRDKEEHVQGGRQLAHSIPIYLEMLNGELELCAIDCVRICEGDAPTALERDHAIAPSIQTHDMLTQVYTQEKLFREMRQRLIERADERFLIVYSNVRNFELVNKLFGVEGGNQLLVGIAEILRHECGPEVIYGRCQDDHFAMLIPADRFDEAQMLDQMERARGLMESPIYSIQIQLGVYAIEDHEMPITTMLEHAELALKTIRNSRKRNIAYYTHGMMERKLKDNHILTAFEQALKDQNFHIYLQPQVRLDGTVVGGEALVRWVRPNGEVVPPGEFLGVLHQSDLLANLDVYVWELAVKQLARWRGTALEPVYISVNVDPSDFYYFDVPARLAALCDGYGVPRTQLRVEITETALVIDSIMQNRIVEQLHAQGFIVEIDDFGKGSSSLSMLKDVHADVLKIDMGFVHGGTNVVRKRVILEAVVAMANNLRMDVVTEGVETREQVDLLSGMGCEMFQGFYFSRPIPVEDFETVVLARIEEK